MAKTTQRRKTRRRYDNRRREEQAAETRAAILRALAAQLVSNNSPEFSVADAAREAGVTPRTVFRHFPTREHMLEGVSEWVLAITGRVALPQSADELGDTVRDSYRMFEENAGLMRALLLSDLGRGVRSRLSPRRRKGLSDALRPAMAGLAPKYATAVTALLGHLVTAETWWQMRDAFGADGESAAEAVAWTIDRILTLLRDGEHPFGSGDDA